MAQFLKPSNLNNVWASGGDRIYPGDTKYATGWQVEIPPRQYFNEIDYKQDQMLAHINQRGIAEWDAETEYQANKSYTQDSTGTIHRCILTHTGQNPELDVSNTYWEIAFANAGDFYTKTESDAAFITPTELGAYSYSKAETYSQSEVNAKTTVASALQAQQQTSNVTLLTPQRLADAFTGSNQNLSSDYFYQELPGGLIIQGGFAPAGTNIVYTLPNSFPTALISLSFGPTSGAGVYFSSFTNSSFTYTTGSGNTCRWIAIGY